MTAPRRPATKEPAKQPRGWGGAFHMLARHYQDYEWAVHQAAKREGHLRALDVDGQESKQGTGWALHWPDVGRNHLHDPKKQISRSARIDHLTDAEIARLRGPDNQRPRRLSFIFRLAHRLNVRIELEAKTLFGSGYVRRLRSQWYVKSMLNRGDFQVKTLATMGAPNGGATRLAVWHDEGVPTILSFSTWVPKTTEVHKGVSKKQAWPVTDYTRGTPHWTP